MANGCTNMFSASIRNENITEKHEEIYNKIERFLEENTTLYNTNLDPSYIEIDFESRWTFPYDAMEKMAEELQEEYPEECKYLYMRCLSYEFGCDYVDYMIYENGEWFSKMKN